MTRVSHERTPARFTPPICVDVGARPALVKEDLELTIRWIDRLWASLEERNKFGPGNPREIARRMILGAFAHYTDKMLP